MSPALNQLVPATLLLSSITYFSTTITNTKPPGGIFTIELEIPNGWIKGVKKVSRNGQRGYYFFRGIPYAEQPVGALRFEPPIPAKPWRPTVLDATRYGSSCLQQGSIIHFQLLQSESCLFLNVAVPNVILPTKTKYPEGANILFPVIVHFHPGGFSVGSSRTFGPSHFMDEDVVFVSLNYRVGFLGFLNTEDDVVRGNMGLKDQTMALKWVQENIVYFGGDPNRVTIMGESAGGVSTHLHLLSPMSRGLFHRAISHSGMASHIHYAFTKNPRQRALILGGRLGCPINSTREMVACIKAVPVKQLNKEIKGRRRMDQFLAGEYVPYGPSVETVHDSNTFLFDTPRNLIRRGMVANVPWIVGGSTNEGLVVLLLAVQNKTISNFLNREWKRYAPLILDYEGHPNADYISTAIRQEYLGKREISRATVRQASLMISDRIYIEGLYDAVHSHALLNPVYAFQYTYKGEFAIASYFARIPAFLPRPFNIFYSFVRTWFLNLLKIRTERLDGGHGDEVALFFPFFFLRIVPGHADYPMSREVIRVWTHFASTGKPGKIFGVEWTPTQMQNQSENVTEYRYLKLESNPMMIPEPFTSRIEFWKGLHLDPDSV